MNDSPMDATVSASGSSAPANEVSAVYSVSDRLPRFWKHDPELWFLQAQTVFANARITSSKRKFEDSVSKLEYDVLKQVADLVRNPPEDPFSELQKRLVNTYSETESARIKRLLEDKQIGDQKPTQFLREMRCLSGGKVPDEMLRTLWLRGLPARMKDILVAIDQADLDKLAVVADRLVETYEPQTLNEVAAASPSQSHPPMTSYSHATPSSSSTVMVPASQLEELCAAVRRLTTEVSTLRRERSRSSSRSSVRSTSSSSKHKLCVYHRRFNVRAKKCKKNLRLGISREQCGKLEAATAEADAVADNAHRRLFVSERQTGEQFLVDTGAAVSVYPATKRSKILEPTDFSLYAANGSKIPTFGEIKLTLDFGLRRPFTWTFILANVMKPIIGADLLFHCGLMVDLRGQKLVDRETGLSKTGQIVNTPVHSIQVIPTNHWCADLLKKFPAVTRPSALMKTPKHSVEHFIETKGPPVTSRARRLPPNKYNEVRKFFCQMVNDGICRPSKSPWSSPLHIVHKKNGEIRPCGDYRALNDKTVPDRYAVPNLLDFQNNLHGSSIFSTIDLNRAYYQIPIHEAHIPKTAIITPFGLFEFVRMSFGLRNSGQTFQRFMDNLLRDLQYVYVFVDDIIVASRNEEEHRKHLHEVFRRLDEAGITINLEKCVFAQPEVDFLGYHVTPKGVTPLKRRTDAICSFPQPATTRQLKRFMGMFNFYHRCIPHSSHIQQPLNNMLKGRTKNSNTTLNWTAETLSAFENCKRAIADATILDHPAFDAKISLATDASASHVGAVLQQLDGNQWKPLGFFSKALTPAQQRYSTYDRELLAVYLAVRHFRSLLEGRQFAIFTDHKPLIHAFAQRVDSAPPRRINQLNFISEFTTDIRHIAGENNQIADALSRIEVLDLSEDLSALIEEQAKDDSIVGLLKNDNLKFEKILLPNLGKSLLCETSTTKPRPYLPQSTRQAVVQRLHGLSHPGIRATRKLVSKRYFWPSMNVDIANWTRTCISCQRSKVQRHTITYPSGFAPVGRFELVHIDLVGPLPPSQGYRYLLTVIDRASRWPEAYPIVDMSAETVATSFFNNWIPRFGVPLKMVTDQGRQFESSLFSSLAKLLGINRCRTTAYHPQANGCVERWHRSLKSAIMTQLNSVKWTQVLPIVLLGLRTTIRDDINSSCAEIVYGQPLCLPGEFLIPSNKPMTEDLIHNFTEVMSKVRPAPFRASTKTCFRHKDLNTSTHVFLRRDHVTPPLTPPYSGPHKVLERKEKTFRIQLPNRQVVVSADRLKPAFLLEDPCSSTTFLDNDAMIKPEKHSPADEPTRTRSGRLIRPVVRFSDVVIRGE